MKGSTVESGAIGKKGIITRFDPKPSVLCDCFRIAGGAGDVPCRSGWWYPPAAALLRFSESSTAPLSPPLALGSFLDRNGGNEWRETVRHARQEDQERALADKRKKLIRTIPAIIPGVSAVVKVDARRDLREIEALVDMQVLTVLPHW